jgi:hypothetical protein
MNVKQRLDLVEGFVREVKGLLEELEAALREDEEPEIQKDPAAGRSGDGAVRGGREG